MADLCQDINDVRSVPLWMNGLVYVDKGKELASYMDDTLSSYMTAWLEHFLKFFLSEHIIEYIYLLIFSFGLNKCLNRAIPSRKLSSTRCLLNWRRSQLKKLYLAAFWWIFNSQIFLGPYLHTYKEGVKIYSLDLHNAVKMSYKKKLFF